MDRGAWQATVHGVATSWTQLKRLSTAQHSFKKAAMLYKLQAPGHLDLPCLLPQCLLYAWQLFHLLMYWLEVEVYLNLKSHLFIQPLQTLPASAPSLRSCHPPSPLHTHFFLPVSLPRESFLLFSA